jgi:GNAT superfamily N-acetyltransferase
MIAIERHESGCGALCRAVLDTLPDWFGMPASNDAYVADAERGPAWVALCDGGPFGLMLLKAHEESLEIWLMAVRRDLRGQGAGTALMVAAEREARRPGKRLLTVKTLGPSDPDEGYRETRAFYRARGFIAVEEFTEIWGPENPTLLMVKVLVP